MEVKNANDGDRLWPINSYFASLTCERYVSVCVCKWAYDDEKYKIRVTPQLYENSFDEL